MARLTALVSCLLPLAATQFVPPDAILQAGYPAGFRAFIPDLPGMELFGFHGKVNSPFLGEELGIFHQDILRPQGGFWVFQDPNIILTPGDIVHYWTLVVKDGVPYPKKNQTWKVTDETVDLLSPVTLKPAKPTGLPEKMRETEGTTPSEDEETETTPTPADEEDTSASSSEESEESEDPEDSEEHEEMSSSSAATPTTPSTTTVSKTTTKKTPTTTTKKPAIAQKPKATKPKKSTPEIPIIMEEVEEFTTPMLPFDSPIPEEFPEESPPLFPFPSLFPRPFKPMMPPNGPGFEICSNPWNFEEQLGETRTQRLERQVAKLQCQLAQFQRGYSQLSNTVENELTDLKKLIYGMVGRMQRLESVLRSPVFG